MRPPKPKLQLDVPGDGELWRGDHKLAHMSQVLSRDLCGQTILQYAGARVLGYTMTDEQIEDCRTGKTPGCMGYRFLLYHPSSCALNWTAFWDEDGLAAFVKAYALQVPESFVPGEKFDVRLPVSDADWLPVRRSAE